MASSRRGDLRGRRDQALRGDRGLRPTASTPGSATTPTCGRLRPARRDGPLIYDGESETVVPGGPAERPVAGRLAAEPGGRASCSPESSQWASAFSNLTQSWRRSPHSASAARITYLRQAAIDPLPRRPCSECEEELLTAQPQTGRDSRRLAMAALRDIGLLERGAKMRTLYQHSARRSSVDAQVRRRRDRPGRRGAHPGRVLQPDDHRRPPGRGDPQPGAAQCRGRRSASRRSSAISSTSSSAPGSGPARSPARRPR